MVNTIGFVDHASRLRRFLAEAAGGGFEERSDRSKRLE